MSRLKNYITLFIGIILVTSCNQLAKEKFVESSYKGIINSKYREKMDHNTQIFGINSKGQDHSMKVAASVFHGAYDYATIGDSIIKTKGELCITIKKKNNNFSDYMTFYYNY